MTLLKNYKDLTFVNLFLDVLPIDAEIDARKLLFYVLSSNGLKIKFLTRLVCSFLYDLARTQFAFIPEILQNSRFERIHELLTKLATEHIISRQTGMHGGKSSEPPLHVSLQHKLLCQDRFSCPP